MEINQDLQGANNEREDTIHGPGNISTANGNGKMWKADLLRVMVQVNICLKQNLSLDPLIDTFWLAGKNWESWTNYIGGGTWKN